LALCAGRAASATIMHKTKQPSMPSAFREGFMSDSIKFGGVTLDCPHVGELAA